MSAAQNMTIVLNNIEQSKFSLIPVAFRFTVLCDWESSRPCLCSKLALFKTSWQMLKVILCCFFTLSANRYGLGLSNKLLFKFIDQGVAKLWPVGGPKKIQPRTHWNPFLLSARVSVRKFFRASNFDKSQFCRPLSYDDEKWLICKPQAIYFGTWLKKTE